MSVSPRLRSRTTLADDDSDVYGPGTDLTLSLVAGMIAMVAFTALLYHNAQSRVAALQQQLKTLENSRSELGVRFGDLDRQYQAVAGELDRLRKRDVRSFDLDRPDPGQTTAAAQEAAKERAFSEGGYQLPLMLVQRIDKIVIPEIIKGLQDLGPDAVDTVEIIGHTDDSRLGTKINTHPTINLGPDEALYQWLHSTNRKWEAEEWAENRVLKPPSISVHSNAELGFLRAVNVMLYLHEKLKSKLPRDFQGLKFRAYSAGPTVLPSLRNESDPARPVSYRYADALRRRIEIKFTKSKGVGIVDGEAFRVEGTP